MEHKNSAEKQRKLTTRTRSGLAMGGLLLAMSLSSSALAQSEKPAEPAKGECHGVNACKGQGECGGKEHSCAGKNSCKGKGWTKTTEQECKDKGGTYKAS